jgi:hypothetical protein
LSLRLLVCPQTEHVEQNDCLTAAVPHRPGSTFWWALYNYVIDQQGKVAATPTLLRQPQEPKLDGSHYHLRTIGYSELDYYVFHVALDGERADKQLLSNLKIGQSQLQAVQYLDFTLGKQLDMSSLVLPRLLKCMFPLLAFSRQPSQKPGGKLRVQWRLTIQYSSHSADNLVFKSIL